MDGLSALKTGPGLHELASVAHDPEIAAWSGAYDAAGQVRDSALVDSLTGLLGLQTS